MSHRKTILWLLLITLCGFALRLYYAFQVFPVRSDAGNFVQFGVAYAQGVRPHLSGFWALLPQYIATLAVRANLDPLRTLQMSSVIFGSFVIFGSGALGWVLTRKPVIGLLSASFVATNYALINLSASGLSESGYLAFLLCGGAVWGSGAGKNSRSLVGAGAFLIALALFFKPYETYIFFAICLFSGLLSALVTKRMRAFGLILIISCVSFLPVWITYSSIVTRLGIEAQSQTKLYNVIYGVTGYDSKVHRAITTEDHPVQVEMRYLEEKGTVGYLWFRRNVILRNYIRNVGASARILNGHLFFGSYRMGLMWAVMVGVLTGISIVRQRMVVALSIPALMAVSVPMLLALGAAHGRWLIQCVPFLLILLAAGVYVLTIRDQALWIRQLALIFLALFVFMNGRNAMIFAGDRWRTNNFYPVTKQLRAWATEEDRIMAFNIPMMMAFYRTNTFNVVNMPYATAHETAELADARGVSWVVYSDSQFPHYPIHAITPETPEWPEQWTLVTNLVFSRHTRFGFEQEVYSIVRVDKP